MPEPETHFKCACQNCAGHIEFPASRLGENIRCPHCGWKTVLQATLGATVDTTAPSSPNPQTPLRRKFITVGMALAVLAAAGGSAAWYFLAHRPAPHPAAGETNAAKAAPSAPAPRADPWHGLMAGPVSLEKAESGNLVYAVGVLRNESNRERFGIRVELDLLDAAGGKVGTASDYAPSLVPGKEWKFKALVMARQIARAEVARVTEQ